MSDKPIKDKTSDYEEDLSLPPFPKKLFIFLGAFAVVVSLIFALVRLGQVHDQLDRIELQQFHQEEKLLALQNSLAEATATYRQETAHQLEYYNQLNGEIKRINKTMFLSTCVSSCRQDMPNTPWQQATKMCLGYCDLTLDKDKP
jgi:hypothetical protein